MSQHCCFSWWLCQCICPGESGKSGVLKDTRKVQMALSANFTSFLCKIASFVLSGILQTLWPLSICGFSCLHQPSGNVSPRIIGRCEHIRLNAGWGNLNSVPQAYKAGVVLTKSSPSVPFLYCCICGSCLKCQSKRGWGCRILRRLWSSCATGSYGPSRVKTWEHFI